MTTGHIFIDGEWQTGHGPLFESLNPATGQISWRGNAAASDDVAQALQAARKAALHWRHTSLNDRLAVCERYNELLQHHKVHIIETICEETGKTPSDAAGEFNATFGKLAISLQAQRVRCGTQQTTLPQSTLNVSHRPLGVVAVFGPFNFPAHLPNGHIIPALLAGNCVLYKPSEQTPKTAELMVSLWQQAGIPKGVINLLQGGRDTGQAITALPLDGLYFTGSVSTGRQIHRAFAGRPETLLALELGGNNPLVVWQWDDLYPTVEMIVQSAYVSAGQRCTCARRLIIPNNAAGDQLITALSARIRQLVVGPPDHLPEPFLGPVINNASAQQLITIQKMLEEAGATLIVPMTHPHTHQPFVTPGLIDVSALNSPPDEEWFGPLLLVQRAPSLEAAIDLANQTQFGLAAGLISREDSHWHQFQQSINAGIINWNQPLTGASSAAPFGGIGASGNHRPSAFYAADYCNYPVASLTPTKEEPRHD